MAFILKSGKDNKAVTKRGSELVVGDTFLYNDKPAVLVGRGERPADIKAYVLGDEAVYSIGHLGTYPMIDVEYSYEVCLHEQGVSK